MEKSLLITALAGPLAALAPWLLNRVWHRAVMAETSRRTQALQSRLQARTAALARELALRRQIEVKLGEFVAEHQALLRSLPDGFALADTDGSLLEVNDALSRMTGWSRSALLQMNVEQLDAARSTDAARMIVPPLPGKHKLRVRCKDEHKLEVQWHIIPIPGLQRFLCFMREIAPDRGTPLRLVSPDVVRQTLPASPEPLRRNQVPARVN